MERMERCNRYINLYTFCSCSNQLVKIQCILILRKEFSKKTAYKTSYTLCTGVQIKFPDQFFGFVFPCVNRMKSLRVSIKSQVSETSNCIII